MSRVWAAKRAFWGAYQRALFKAAKPLVVPVPQDLPAVRAVPFSRAYPNTPIDGVVVADHAPKDEYARHVLAVKRFQLTLYRVVSPMHRGLPEIDADPNVALAAAYTAKHEKHYRRPARPAEYDVPKKPGGVDLGALAVASPYACYLRRDERGTLVWDLSALAGFEVYPQLVPPAARVEFELRPEEHRVEPIRIDSELGSSVPGDDTWDDAVRLAMCAVSTHVSLVRHFNWVHLVTGGPLAIVTHNTLPAAHPVTRLLRPHVYATHFGNRIVTIDQMERGGDFENMFSFTHDGMCKLFAATAGDFDLRWFDPAREAEFNGVADLPIDTPARDNRMAIMRVIRDHVARYLAIYRPTDDDVQGDADLVRWVDALAGVVPHGVFELAGRPPTLAGVTDLIAILIYMGAVEHEIVDTGTFDYQLWNDIQPVRVHRDGRRVPLDVYQRFVNWNFSLNVDRTLLTTDFSNLALDEQGAAAFRQFRRELLELQATMESEPFAPWRLQPKFLKANINY
jgi:arachidonate 15-lipoxygenase